MFAISSEAVSASDFYFKAEATAHSQAHQQYAKR